MLPTNIVKEDKISNANIFQNPNQDPWLHSITGLFLIKAKNPHPTRKQLTWQTLNLFHSFKGSRRSYNLPFDKLSSKAEYSDFPSFILCQ